MLEDPVELADYLQVLRKRWALILALVLVGLCIAAGVSLVQRPTYEATAEVFVSTQGGETSADRQQGNNYTLERVKTYAHLATTEIVLDPVIEELGLDTTPNLLAEEVTATAVVDTTIVQITARHTDPEVSAELADTIAATLATVVEDAEAAEADGGNSPVKLTTAQSATMPLQPVAPRVPVYLGLGGLAGLALGFGFAILRELLDTRVRGVRDIEVVTDHPLVGRIGLDNRAKGSPLLVQSAPLSPVAESFRALRTNLQFIEVDGSSRSFAITSSIAGEGKSTTAVNLALSLADAGQTVALVDADLRQPSVASYMGLEGVVGLTDVLINRVDLADAMQAWGDGGLFVLPAGQVPPNPSELLGSKAMQDLVSTLEKEFDWAVFDAPPLLPVTDAVVLAKHLSGALVVVKTGETTRHQVEAAVEALESVEAPVAGLVLTMVPPKTDTDYGYTYAPRETTPAPKRGGRRSADATSHSPERSLTNGQQVDKPTPADPEAATSSTRPSTQ